MDVLIAVISFTELLKHIPKWDKRGYILMPGIISTGVLKKIRQGKNYFQSAKFRIETLLCQTVDNNQVTLCDEVIVQLWMLIQNRESLAKEEHQTVKPTEK
jgi:predicted methyltransferase